MTGPTQHSLPEVPEDAKLAAFEAITEGNFLKFTDPEGQEEYVWGLIDAAFAAALPSLHAALRSQHFREFSEVLRSDKALAMAAEGFEQEVGTPAGHEWPCGSTDEAMRPALQAALAYGAVVFALDRRVVVELEPTAEATLPDTGDLQ